jgi:Uncharacterized protein conserved in bacteria
MPNDLNMALKKVSTHDQLTGLPNRRLILDRCGREDHRTEVDKTAYALLAGGTASRWPNPSPAASQSQVEDLGWECFSPTQAATTVRLQNGTAHQAQDGPFQDTKEQLGGLLPDRGARPAAPSQHGAGCSGSGPGPGSRPRSGVARRLGIDVAGVMELGR